MLRIVDILTNLGFVLPESKTKHFASPSIKKSSSFIVLIDVLSVKLCRFIIKKLYYEVFHGEQINNFLLRFCFCVL